MESGDGSADRIRDACHAEADSRARFTGARLPGGRRPRLPRKRCDCRRWPLITRVSLPLRYAHRTYVYNNARALESAARPMTGRGTGLGQVPHHNNHHHWGDLPTIRALTDAMEAQEYVAERGPSRFRRDELPVTVARQARIASLGVGTPRMAKRLPSAPTPGASRSLARGRTGGHHGDRRLRENPLAENIVAPADAGRGGGVRTAGSAPATRPHDRLDARPG